MNANGKRAVLGLALLLTLSIGGAARASEPTAEPWITIEASFDSMAKSINRVVRLVERNDRNADPVAGSGNWFEDCCRYNIEKVAAGAAQLKQGMNYLEAQYARDDNLDALRRLNEMRAHVAEVVTTFGELGQARSRREAGARLHSLYHPFNHARQLAQGLEECCAVEPPPAESDPGQ
jgi:hypothetical protein